MILTLEGYVAQSRHNPANTTKSWLKSRFSLIAIASAILAAFLLYAATLRNYFVADDFIFLNQLHFTQPTLLDNLVYFTRDWGLGVPFYRPFTRMFWTVEYDLFGLNPLGWHFFSTLLYASTSGLLYLLCWKLSNRQSVALLASAFFIVHPAHTEIVSWVANESDLLVAIFCLSGAILYMEAHRTTSPARFISRYILALTCFTLALLSKESAAGFILVPLAYDILFGSRSKLFQGWRNVHTWLGIATRQLPFFGVLMLYLAVRLTFLGDIGGYASEPGQAPLLVSVFMESYAKWMVMPFNSVEPTLLIGVIVLLIVFRYVLSSKALQQARGEQHEAITGPHPSSLAFHPVSMAAFGLVWLLLFLLPVIGTAPSVRFAYLPTIGLSLLIAAILTPTTWSSAGPASDPQANYTSRRLYGLSAVTLLFSLLIFGVLAYSALSALAHQDAWYRASQTANYVLSQTHDIQPHLADYSYVYAVGLPDSNEEALIFRTGFPHAIQLIYDNPTIDAVTAPSFRILEDRLNVTYFVEYRDSRIIKRDDIVEALQKRNASIKARNVQPVRTWDFQTTGNPGQTSSNPQNDTLGWTLLKGYSAVERTQSSLRIALTGSSQFSTPNIDLRATSLDSLELTLQASPQTKPTDVQVPVHWVVATPGGTTERVSSQFTIHADGLRHTYRVKPTDASAFLYNDVIHEIWLDFSPDLGVVNLFQATVFELQ